MGVNPEAAPPSLEMDIQGHRREGERGTLGRTPDTFMLRSVFVLRSSLIVALFPPVSGAKNTDNHHLRCNQLSERDGRL